MKILILGATGRTGKHVLEEALKKGHDVHVLVRNADKLPVTQNLQVFTGTPIDIDILNRSMQGCDAIISTLNISRKSDFPWSPLRTPKDFLSSTMKNIISLAEKNHIKRIIAMTAWGVNESKKEIPGWFRWFIDHSNIKYPYLDHGKLENILTQTSLDWTIIRPAGLTNSKKIREVKVSFNANPKPGLTISRRNVAKFMIEVLEKGSYVRALPTIS